MTPHPVIAPPEGEVLVVSLDGGDTALWWGPDGDIDRFAAVGGRILTWPTARACSDFARGAGLAGLGTDDVGDPAIGYSTMDVNAVQDWLRNPRTPLPADPALNLWNCQWDIVATQTGAYPVLSREQRRCHDKLTSAAVPWLTGEETYRPRWTAAELRCVRQALSNAVHALRTVLA